MLDASTKLSSECLHADFRNLGHSCSSHLYGLQLNAVEYCMKYLDYLAQAANIDIDQG